MTTAMSAGVRAMACLPSVTLPKPSSTAIGTLRAQFFSKDSDIQGRWTRADLPDRQGTGMVARHRIEPVGLRSTASGGSAGRQRAETGLRRNVRIGNVPIDAFLGLGKVDDSDGAGHLVSGCGPRRSRTSDRRPR